MSTRACKFVFTTKGCVLGAACSYSHDPDAVNRQYSPSPPLRFCTVEGCTNVSTFRYCLRCFQTLKRCGLLPPSQTRSASEDRRTQS